MQSPVELIPRPRRDVPTDLSLLNGDIGMADNGDVGYSLSKGMADELSEELIDVRWFEILMYSLLLDLFKKGAMTVNELRNIGFYLVQDTLAGS